MFMYSFDWVFHNPYCGMLFGCGCTYNWLGGWDGCNVHNRHGPQCPWCSIPWKWPSLALFASDRFVIALSVLVWAALAANQVPRMLRLTLPAVFWLAYVYS